MPIGINAVREALTDGDCIMVTQRRFSEPDSKSGALYTLKCLGRAIPNRTLQKLRDDLIPLDKGLFDDAPQSFILKPQA